MAERKEKQSKPATGFRKGFLLSSSQKSKQLATAKPKPKKAAVSSVLSDIKEDSSPSKPQKKNALPQSKQKSTTGMRKGFLLSPSPKKENKTAGLSQQKPEKVKASSALLDMEEDQNPLLLVAENDAPSETTTATLPEAPKTMPLHIIVSEEDDAGDDLGLTAVSTKKKITPLVQEVSTDDKPVKELNDSGSYIQPTDEKEEPALLWEMPPGVPHGEPPPAIIDVAAQSPPAASEAHLSELAHELTTMLWKLKRHRPDSDEQSDVKQFVSEHIQCNTDWNFAWDFILKAVAEDSSSRRSPSVRLGIMLFQMNEGLDSFVSFLNPGEDKHSRVLALGGAELINQFCERMRETKMPIANKAWLTRVLPRLSEIVLECPTKRSVLSQQCITAAYEILALVSEQEDGIARLNLESTLWDALFNIDKLLQVQHGWIEKSLPDADSRDGSADATRKKCTLAVLSDWRLILREALRLHESLQIEGERRPADDALARLTEYTCLQLKGDSSDVFPAFGLGGFHQTLSDHPPKLTAEEILSCLKSCMQLLQSIKEKEESDEMQSWQTERLRGILRGIAAWLGQNKKNLHSLAKQQGLAGDSGTETTCLRQATDFSIVLLRCDNYESVDLILVIVSCLWSSSNGLPPDFVCDSGSDSETVPESFVLLLNELNRDGEQDADVLEPTERAICVLVVRCIQCRGASLVNVLVERNGMCSSTVDVLADLLSFIGHLTLDGSNSRELLTMVGNTFLDSVGSIRYAQEKLMSTPNLLCTLPIETVVPRLVAVANSNMDNTCVVAAVAAAICRTVESSIPSDVETVIRTMVESLARCDEDVVVSDGGQSGNKTDTPRSSRLCRKLAGRWRGEILDCSVCGENGLAAVLVAIARAMFADPSSSVPLALFGSVVGDELPLMASNEDHASRARLAVIALMKQCLEKLGEAGDGHVQVKESNSIYARLSPLLLLRRLPSGYYKVAWKVGSNDREEMMILFSELANQLSLRLGTPGHPTEKEHLAFSAEERQLAAEIAGRCLPFYELASPSCSCYQRMCHPAFVTALQTLKIIPSAQQPMTPKESLRAARAALFACCNHIPFAEDSEPGEGVFGTVSFVLEVLNVDSEEADEDHIIDEDLIQLQTGCIEFIAVCLESTLQRHMKKKGTEPFDSTRIVEGEAPSNPESGDATKEALATSCSDIASTIRAGKPIPCRLRLSSNLFPSTSSSDNHREISTAARTCMWNAFLIVSQRCPNDGRLNSWANLTAPWVLDWASSAPVDDNLRHPLCMAAALQVLFVLITRTKSFECLAGGKTTPTSVHKAHSLAIARIKTETKLGGVYARTTMRKAALKLLLALVTIDQVDSSSSLPVCLSPGELGETFTLLNGIANVDTHAEVRMLAAHILSGMRAS